MWIDDQILAQSSQDFVAQLWSPNKTLVVLGSGNQFQKECWSQHCQEDRVEVLKRHGGGGAVVLHSGCIIISLGMWVKDFFRNNYYFTKINDAIRLSLADRWPIFSELSQQGICDICYGQRKLAGVSLFRSRNYLLYQASLLHKTKIDTINRYLKHPSCEPEYRQKKNHSAFLTSIDHMTKEIKQQDVLSHLNNHLEKKVKKLLKEELIGAQTKQIENLLNRVKQNKGIITDKIKNLTNNNSCSNNSLSHFEKEEKL